MAMIGGILLNMVNGFGHTIGSSIVYIISYYREALNYDIDEDSFFFLPVIY
jgi:hypothetical protein